MPISDIRMERLVVHLFGALAEFERNLIRERTNAGQGAGQDGGTKTQAEIGPGKNAAKDVRKAAALDQ